MKNMIALFLAPLALALACGSTISEQDAGLGGSSSTATSSPAPSSSASAISGASGAPVDAGHDALEEPPPPEDAKPVCGSCDEALFGPDHLAGEQHLCPGSLAEGNWYAWIACACAPPPTMGNCYSACSGSAFCAGIYPGPGPWADPDGVCKACLGAANPNGCAEQALTCSKT